MLLTAHVSAVNKRSQSVRKYSNRSETLHENEENGYVQVLIRKEELVELQNIVNGVQNKADPDSRLDAENVSPNQIATICNILAKCGILNEATKQ